MNAIRFLCPVVLVTALASPSAAGGKYDVRHRFSITPQVTSAPLAPEVRSRSQLKTFTQNDTATQTLNNVIEHTFAGGGGVFTDLQPNTLDKSEANANSDYVVNPFVAGGKVSGTVRAYGDATARAKYPGYASAGTQARLTVRGRFVRNGVVTLGCPRWAQSSGSATDFVRSKDPIDFSIFNDDGSLFDEGLLFDSLLELHGGSFLWDEGNLAVDSGWFKLWFEVPGVDTTQKGALNLTVYDHLVVEATKSGIYESAILPSVGTSGPFVATIPHEIALDYDIGPVDPDKQDVQFGYGNEGNAADVVPEPSSMVVLAASLAVLARRRRRKL